jgi:nucleoside-diphosphate-sugar epimerase
MPPLPPRDLDHMLRHAAGAFQSLAGARIFITGGTGFVGSWLVESLLRANDRLNLGISAVLLTRDPDRFRSVYPHLSNHPALTVLHGDVRSFEFPKGEFPYVIHAAMPDPAPEADAEGMRHILEFAATHGTRRFLFTSSGAVYGRQPPELMHIPEDYASEPVTAYGKAKRASELFCSSYSQKHGFSALIARLFAFTGPRLPLDANYAVGNFVRDALAGGPVGIAGDGTPYRSYLYAADLAIWLWTILIRGGSCRPYNVGSGQAVTIAELARVVVDATAPGMPIEIAQKPVPGAPAMYYVPSVERAERELGLRPVIALEEGVRRMYEWAKGPQ